VLWTMTYQSPVPISNRMLKNALSRTLRFSLD
jgi:hypothetical protein